MTTTSAPTTADLLCGFVPPHPVVAALGGHITESGQVLGTGINRTGSCTLKTADSDFPAMEVFLGPAVNNSVGPDAALVVHDVKINKDNKDWTFYPPEKGIGWAHPQYESTVEGHKVTGALSYLAWGDWVIGVRLYRPRPGHDAVREAMAVVSSIPPAMGLSKQPSSPYPSYTSN